VLALEGKADATIPQVYRICQAQRPANAGDGDGGERAALHPSELPAMQRHRSSLTAARAPPALRA